MINPGVIAAHQQNKRKKLEEQQRRSKKNISDAIDVVSKEQFFKWQSEGLCGECGAPSGEYEGICDECRTS